MSEQRQRPMHKGPLSPVQQPMSHNRSYTHCTSFADEVCFVKGKAVASKGNIHLHLYPGFTLHSY